MNTVSAILNTTNTGKTNANKSSKSNFSITESYSDTVNSNKNSFFTTKNSNNDTFKDVFDTKVQNKSDNKVNRDDFNKNDNKIVNNENNNKIEEKTDKLEEKTVDNEEKDDEKVSEEKKFDPLSYLLNFLDQLSEKQALSDEDMKKIKENILEILMGDNENEELTKTQYNEDLEKLIAKLSEILEDNNITNSSNKDSLNYIKELLSKFNETIDNMQSMKDIRTNIENLISQITDEAESNQGNKVLSLEELLNSNLSKQTASDNKDSESSFNMSQENKDEAFLNKLLNNNLMGNFNGVTRFQGNNIQASAVPERVIVNANNIVQDLITNVKLMVTDSIKELTVKVNPANLGQIAISLTQEDGVMKATLKASSRETTELIAQNLVEIKKQLSEQNIKIAEVNIELYQEDTTFFKNSQFNESLSQEQKKTSDGKAIKDESISEEIEEVQDNMAEQNNTLDFLA